MSQYIRFDIEATLKNQNGESRSAKVAKVANLNSQISNFSTPEASNTEMEKETTPTLVSCSKCFSQDMFISGPVRVCKICRADWLLPCPRCGDTHWRMPNRQWRCKTCGDEWIAHVDTRRIAPTSTLTIPHPDGREMTLAIYRCPGCRGTNWGPKINEPDIWWCLDCHRHEIDEQAVFRRIGRQRK